MKKILFIEDESALQKTLGEILQQEGFEIIPALDGEIGLRLANSPAGEKKPDLILLDLVLPKVDGFEVLKKLKESENTKEIPVIVLTNLERVEDVDKALKLGATTYLVKASYSLEEVVRKIKKALKLAG
jgi:DNA-binding response OmpR family regulator